MYDVFRWIEEDLIFKNTLRSMFVLILAALTDQIRGSGDYNRNSKGGFWTDFFPIL